MTTRTLEDRVAIVCGAGDGIGRSCALVFAGDGADMALAARSADRLERIADEVRALGRRALAIPTDITDMAQCRHLVARTIAELGRLDAVVNVATTADRNTPVEDTDWDDFRHLFEKGPESVAPAPTNILVVTIDVLRTGRVNHGPNVRLVYAEAKCRGRHNKIEFIAIPCIKE